MAFIPRSPWILHYDGSSCNGCDIEVLAALSPVYDAERLGVINTGNPKHADILLITGSVNEQNRQVIYNLYEQMPDPKVVAAVGICATSGGIFAECYNVLGGISKILPVDVFIPGCAARPEAIIDGVIEATKILADKRAKLAAMAAGKEQFFIETAGVSDAEEILALQKLVYRSEAELYNDFSLSPLRQNIEEMKEDIRNMTVLKAVMSDTIVGSVRARQQAGSVYIGRLVIHPLYQTLGIGHKLLLAIEERFPSAQRYETFTGHKSRRRMHFLETQGYRQFRSEEAAAGRTRVYFEKNNPGGQS